MINRTGKGGAMNGGAMKSKIYSLVIRKTHAELAVFNKFDRVAMGTLCIFN